MKPEERINAIKQALIEALSPTKIIVEDEGYQHVGHVGAQTGQGHFYVMIASPEFAGKTTLACHRLIYSALGTLMDTDIHALRIKIEK